jgi:adenosylcobyric acid synthase
VAADTDIKARREHGLDLLADAVEEHLDTAALTRLIEHGPPSDLPFVPPGSPQFHRPPFPAGPRPEPEPGFHG